MTQKQTDYDKALKKAVNQINDNRHRWNMGEAVEFAFRKGYEYGREQSTESDNTSQNIADCDIDHFRDSAKMMRAEFAKAAMQGLLANSVGLKNIQGYADDGHSDDVVEVAEFAVNYADALIAELEKPTEP